MIRSGLFRGFALAMLLMAFPAWARVPALHPVIDPHHVDGSSLGSPIDLTSAWLIQQGDDPRYADPGFDDSRWMVVQAGRKLSTYGLSDVDQLWYRTHVRISPGLQDVSLLLRNFGGSFEIFVNGVEVGSSAPHQARGSDRLNFDEIFAIPPALLQSGDLAIAVRASIGRFSEAGAQDGGFMRETMFELGPASLLFDGTSLYLFRSYASNMANIVMEFLVPLIALALALTLPKEREYFALFISWVCSAVVDSFGVWQFVSNTPSTDLGFVVSGVLQGAAVIALLEFVRLVLGLRRSRLWAGYEWLIGLLSGIAVPLINHYLAFSASVSAGAFLTVVVTTFNIVSLPITAGVPVLALWVWWKRRNPDALLLFVPFFLQSLVSYCNFTLFLLNRFHLTESTSLPVVPFKRFFVQWSEVASFLFSVSMLLFLVLRTVRIARSRAAMASDLHAVQSVQDILLAGASHDTPGFRVERAYYPALEVGGDFFLVSPGPEGSLTAIVGDVSGKGLVAAMRVSMILGVLRREEHREPETILQNLNDALLLQGEMGFTTACCVRLEHDGHYTIANAGHISPYVGGEEIPTPPALPLGIEENQTYEQVYGVLSAGQTLVLMSDGVVEARSAKGELYGFERLAKLTLKPANDIANVAVNFGQEDDITVLTVACAA
jgi:hypothetical protein